MKYHRTLNERKMVVFVVQTSRYFGPCLILPYPAVSCRILPYLPYPAVSCRILPYPAVSCRISPYPAVSCRILPYSAVSCRILPYPAVSCRILPYPAVSPHYRTFCAGVKHCSKNLFLDFHEHPENQVLLFGAAPLLLSREFDIHPCSHERLGYPGQSPLVGVIPLRGGASWGHPRQERKK